MKKICFFNSSDFWGGGEMLHLENAIEFRNRGFQVVVAANPNSELWKRAQKNGFDTMAVRINSLSFLNIIKLMKLQKQFSVHKIDTLIFTTSQDFKTASIAGYLANIPRVVYLRGLAVPIKRSLVNQFCMTRACTHIIANSEETKRTILQHFQGILPADSVKTIYHGIQPELLENKKLSGHFFSQKSKGIILGNAGRLTKQKGQHHLIEVARHLKEEKIEFTLYIAGTGELLDELTESIEKHHLQNDVILLGFVKEMEIFMQSIDLFLLTSSWEGFGFAIVEAMAKGKPVVAFNTTSNPEIITDQKTGLLADFSEPKDFAQKTKELILDPTLRKRMGEAAKQSVVDRFIIQDRVAELEKYIAIK
ncbi:MAG: glycosyltransferase family 4 protein [Bacteroidia bacterium]|nr:glycosyltransferase family 4 protein [Bacteroidia bacterium]